MGTVDKLKSVNMLYLLASIISLSFVQSANIVEVLQKHGATTLVDLAVKAGLADTLTGEGPLTVFAPTNEAISELPASLVQALMEDTELLKQVLLYHVVAGSITSDLAENNIELDSVQGKPLHVNLYLKSKYYNGFITINGKRVVNADERFSTLVTAAKAAGIVDTLKQSEGLTIFAPTNDAFAKVPSDALNGLLADKDALTAVLLRHAVPGKLFAKGVMWAEHGTAGGEMIATQVFRKGVVKVVSNSGGKRAAARVVDTDITATNGVVHAIDTVI